MAINAPHASTFVDNIAQIVRNVIRQDVPAFVTAVVTAIETSNGDSYLKVQRVGNTAPDGGYVRTLASYSPTVGDVVLCARVGGSLVVLGKVAAHV